MWPQWHRQIGVHINSWTTTKFMRICSSSYIAVPHESYANLLSSNKVPHFCLKCNDLTKMYTAYSTVYSPAATGRGRKRELRKKS